MKRPDLDELERYATVRETRWSTIHTPTPKQTAFLSLDQTREAFFGGAAGGGKSDALLMAAAQYVDVPGYAALILRRNYKQLAMPGALMARSKEWWRGTGAVWNEGTKTWTFPSKATITFGHVQNPGDVTQYESAEFQYCVARGTPILMGDGTEKPIDTIRSGDVVATLEGPKPVTAAWRVGRRDAVKVTTDAGSSVVSAEHPILTSDGWVAPNALQPTTSRRGRTIDVASTLSRRAARTLSSWTRSGLRRASGPVRRHRRAAQLPATVASRGGSRNGSEASDDSPPAARPPRPWFARLTLFVPAPRSTRPAAVDVPLRDSTGCGSPDCRPGCRPGSRCDDAQPRPMSGADRRRFPSRADVEAPSLRRQLTGDRGSIRGRTRKVSGTYRHPYTNEARPVTEAVRTGRARMDQAGAAEMFDLTVADANHYVLASSHIIVKNCAFDEVTQFEEAVYTFMFSRLRRSLDIDVPLRMRSASNPSGIGFGWVKRKFVEPATRKPGTIFVRSLLQDNPFLDYDEYAESLGHLSKTLREKLIRGDWDIMESGTMFSPYEWLTDWVDSAPHIDVEARVRSWDLAFAEKIASNDPDFTAGVLMSRDARSGVFTVEHITQWQHSSGHSEKLIRATAERDGINVPVYIEKMPGAGSQVTQRYKRAVLAGFTVRDSHPGGMQKAVRAEPFAAAMENGLVRMVRGDWNEDFMTQLTQFPDDCPHDDMVDAAVYAYRALAGVPSTVDEYIPHASMTNRHAALAGRR